MAAAHTSFSLGPHTPEAAQGQAHGVPASLIISWFLVTTPPNYPIQQLSRGWPPSSSTENHPSGVWLFSTQTEKGSKCYLCTLNNLFQLKIVDSLPLHNHSSWRHINYGARSSLEFGSSDLSSGIFLDETTPHKTNVQFLLGDSLQVVTHQLPSCLYQASATPKATGFLEHVVFKSL